MIRVRVGKGRFRRIINNELTVEVGE